MTEHAIRATREESLLARMRPSDRVRDGMEKDSEISRGCDPWENVRCVCGETFDSLREARKHLDGCE